LILLRVCLAAHAPEFLDGLPYLSNFYCLPGRAGGFPWLLSHDMRRRKDFGRDGDETAEFCDGEGFREGALEDAQGGVFVADGRAGAVGRVLCVDRALLSEGGEWTIAD
jgi:hypothetical protein